MRAHGRWESWPRARWLGVPALLLALAGLWIDRPMFFAAWLVAWWMASGIVLGALANAWLHTLTGGQWGALLRPATVLLASRLPWLLLLLLPLAAGLQQLYPWAADGPATWTRDMARPEFVLAWLQPGRFALRMLLYAAGWWWLSRPATLVAMTKGHAARALLANALISSLAGIDLVMSLMPGWYSSAFGMLMLISQMLAGATACVLLVAAFTPQRAGAPAPGAPPVWRDLGNLLLAYLMTWAYIAFMQFLIIWAEDLPREIAWYLPRLDGGWAAMSAALVVLHFALPFLALLFRALKDHPRPLAWLAAGLLVAELLDAAWLVLPSVAPHSLHGWWLVPLCACAFALLLFGDLPQLLRQHRAPAPDPSMEEQGATA